MKVRGIGVTAAVVTIAGLGCAAGIALGGGRSNAPTPVQTVQVVAATSSPTLTPTVKAASPVNAPRVATVKPVQQPVQQAPVRQAVVTSPRPADTSTPAPAPSSSDPVQIIPVTPDSQGRAGNAPPPPPAPTQDIAAPNQTPTNHATPAATPS